ncbi:MAG TPA: hypothetical protein VK509_20955 [Polyangiales bacterium]|nr:hypothetical protein [Polyangiales bacterium]
MRWGLAMLVLVAGVAPARADRVHLANGSVIEGKASALGDKVVVEIDSGAITLSRDSVTKIEAGESNVQRVAARYAQLKPGDVRGLLELADFCRDHGMPARERELLQQVIEHAPDHAQARARLGYVRSGAGWITHDEHMRAQGFVLHQGQWLERKQVLELERLHAQAETAAHDRDQARLELERQKLALEQARAEVEASKERAAEAERAAETNNELALVQPYPRYVVWGHRATREPICPSGFVATGRHGHCKRIPAPARRHTPFPIVGAKDPFDYLRSR